MGGLRLVPEAGRAPSAPEGSWQQPVGATTCRIVVKCVSMQRALYACLLPDLVWSKQVRRAPPL